LGDDRIDRVAHIDCVERAVFREAAFSRRASAYPAKDTDIQIVASLSRFLL
jgi:hypothetical protein